MGSDSIDRLDTAIALLAADLRREHRLATADAIVYATARHQGADLLSCDDYVDAWETVTPGSWKASTLDRLLAEADCVGNSLEVLLAPNHAELCVVEEQLRDGAFRRSPQLPFRAAKENGLLAQAFSFNDFSLAFGGRPCRDRTCDQRIKSPLLYQLS